jgi:hypothetical protein
VTFATAFQPSAFQNDAFQIAGGPVPPDPVGVHDSYAPDERRKRGLEWKRKRVDLRAELERIYAELHGELKEVAPVAEIRAAVAEYAAPSDAFIPPVIAIDFAALAADISAVKALYGAYQRALDEQDDEEAILLLS